MSSTTESIMFGNTSTPWKHGYSAGGSSGGAAAAVAAGVVPLAHGSDIGGSIRIPASYCGGVGMKPSRGRIPLSPLVDEGGLGFSTNLVQTRTVRDAAVMLDWLSKPQLGDPFVIPKPADTYAKIARQASGPLRVALITNAIAGAQPDAEVVAATDAAAKHLAGMGHAVDTFAVDIGGIETLIGMNKLFFFGFADRLDGYAKRMGRSVNGDTIEPVMLKIYNWSRTLTTADYFAAVSLANIARRKAAQVFAKHDVWLSPTTARTAEPWGRYHLARKDVEPTGNLATEMFAVPCQYTIPHNLMGTPAISLPLALHSNGLPIGVQIAARPAEDHIVLQLATALEAAMPWRGRVPALHVSNKG